MCIYVFVYVFFKHKRYGKNSKIRQCFECKCGMSKNANEDALADNIDASASYPETDPDAT